jgi:hypothetical protein
MPINAKNPIVRPAITLDKYWIQSLRINAAEVGGDAQAEIVLIPYNNSGDKDYTQPKVIKFHNILSEISAGNVKLAQAFGAIMAAVQEKENE